MPDSNDYNKVESTYHLGCAINLSEYILLAREERIKHIDLTSECFYDHDRKDTRPLLEKLEVIDDVENWTEARIHRCHVCSNGRRRGDCSNPKHQYLGTASENAFDIDPVTRKKIQQAVTKARSIPIVLRHIDTKKLYHFSSQYEAARELNLAACALSRMYNGQRKSHKGFEVYRA